MNSEEMFDRYADLLHWTAKKSGLTYQQVNVYVFCVAYPAITAGLIVSFTAKKMKYRNRCFILD